MKPIIVIRVILCRQGGGKLADAEVLFKDGPLDGLRLVGFSIWGKRKTEKVEPTVTFPKRSYQTRGKEKRDYMMLRPQVGRGPEATCTITNMILEAYEAQRQQGQRA